jgi:hypothetical protein
MVNGFRLLKKVLSDNNTNVFTVLLMITVGYNMVINLGFTTVVKYIMKNTKANKTQISFEVGTNW